MTHYKTDTLYVNYPCFFLGTCGKTRGRIPYKVMKLSLTGDDLRILEKGDPITPKSQRKSRQRIIYVDYYCKKETFEKLVKDHVAKRYHVKDPESIRLEWEKGDIINLESENRE